MNRISKLCIALAVAAVPVAASAQYGRYDGRTVRCESDGNRTEMCRVDTRGGVRLVDQESRSPCIQGRTWGYDRSGIWVANGCRARFQVGNDYAYTQSRGYYDPRYTTSYRGNGYTTSRSYYGNRYPTTSNYYGARYPSGGSYYGNRYPSTGGYYGNNGYYGNYYGNRYSNPIAAVLGAVLGAGGGYDDRYYGRQAQAFRCESVNGQPRFCRLPFNANQIQIRRQLSSTRCSEGYNWGWQPDGVWVERGCRAEFVVY